MTQAVLSVDPPCLWKPSNPDNTEMERFRKHVNSKFNLSLGKQKKVCDKQMGLNMYKRITRLYGDGQQVQCLISGQLCGIIPM